MFIFLHLDNQVQVHNHFVTNFRRGAMKAAHSKEVLPQEKRDSKPPRVLCKSTCQKLE
jgi:hypothetical protein